MQFQEQWRHQMNGILTDMFSAPLTSVDSNGMRNGFRRAPPSYSPSMGAYLLDSPPSMHNLSLNSATSQPPYYPHQWDYNQRCRYW